MGDFTQPKPQKEHEWLQQLVGEWKWEGDAAEPEKENQKHHGTEIVRSIGGLWIVAEGRGQAPDGAASESVMTLGYNPEKSAFVGTFVASMMTEMWVYQGWLDSSKNELVLDTEGPSFEDMTRRARYKDVIRIVDKDNRIMTSSYQGEGGSWYQFMSLHYRRK